MALNTASIVILQYGTQKPTDGVTLFVWRRLPLIGTREVVALIVKAHKKVINFLDVLSGGHAVLHAARLRDGLGEHGLDLPLSLPLVLTRLADGDDLIRQCGTSRIHQSATI